MTTWTLDQVRAVKSAGAVMHVDAHTAQTSQALGHVAMDTAEEFVAYVRELLTTDGVDDAPHAEDLVVVTEPDEPQYGPGALVLAVRWRPAVRIGELVGGRLDGTLCEIPDPMALHSALKIQTPEVSVEHQWVEMEEGTYPEAMRVQTYVLSGWNNTERHWRLTLETSS